MMMIKCPWVAFYHQGVRLIIKMPFMRFLLYSQKRFIVITTLFILYQPVLKWIRTSIPPHIQIHSQIIFRSTTFRDISLRKHRISVAQVYIPVETVHALISVEDVHAGPELEA